MRPERTVQYDDHKAITRPPAHLKDRPHGWIQWKGTDVCMDVVCQCGANGHIDAEFCYYIKCEECGRIYALSGYIELLGISGEPNDELERRAVIFKNEE